MGLITGSIASLHNGVSQQSPLVRAAEQCERQLNAWSSLADGTGKRAPTETIQRVLEVAPDNAFIHAINRDLSEQYLVIVADGAIRVFDFEGVEKTVTAPGGWGYLADITDFSSQVALTTVADYTFVVNRTRTCAMAAAGVDIVPDPVYAVWPNREYGSDILGMAFGPGQAFQYPPNPAIGAMTGVVQAFDKLPAGAPEGAIYTVTGSETTNFVSYYVRKNGGVWDECVAPGLTNAVDGDSMPFALVRQADGTFVFAPFTWAPRRVGDIDTNPQPTFIGRPINDVVFYQNRLGFLTDENVILSVIGDYGNFWRMTVLDYIDSDVISLAATSTKVSILVDAVPFTDGILLTSDQTQFSLTNGEAGVSATSIAIRPVTNYAVNTNAGMVAMGSEVYFASDQNGHAVIREYARNDNSDSTSAADITAHVPRYIPAGVHQLIPAGDLNALFALTSGKPNAVYVYQFYWIDGTTKAQSAWHEWTLQEGCEILSGCYQAGLLHLIVRRPDGLFLERMNLQSGAKPSSCAYQVHLDRRCSTEGIYYPGTDTTEFILPYVPADHAAFRMVRTDAFTTRPLSLVDPVSVTWVSPAHVRVPGNETAGPLLAGDSYTFRYRFSALHPKRQDGTAITTGRFQLRTMTVNYQGTAYFRTEVAPYGDEAMVQEVLPAKVAAFTGKVLGSADLILNRPLFHSGRYAFQLYGRGDVTTIELVNDTHVSSTFVSAEWEAFYWNRAN